MQKDLFEPKLGHPRSRDASNNKTVSNRLIKESTKGLSRGPRKRGPLTRRPVAELARGKGLVFALKEPRAGSRRVLVKARIVRHTYWELERLPNANALTWLDSDRTAKSLDRVRALGFGAEVLKAVDARKTWLLEQGLLKRASDGQVSTTHNFKQQLEQRSVQRLVKKLENETGIHVTVARSGEAVRGRFVESYTGPTRKYAVLERARQPLIVPWSAAMGRKPGRLIEGIVRGHSFVLAKGKTRDLGLSL